MDSSRDRHEKASGIFSLFFQSRAMLVSLLLGAFFCSPMACTSKNPSPSSGSSHAASPVKENRLVNLGIWANYLSPELLDEFEKATGIRVQVSNYSSNEELVAKLQAGGSGYDVVSPSDYMVSTMIKLKLIQPLDLGKIPNFKLLDPRYLKKPYDPKNEYSLPYDWGTTGIAVNRVLYKGEVTSWKDLFYKPDLAGKFSLLDDAREAIGAGLKALGFSMNSRIPEEITQAKELLIRNRSRVKSFQSETLASLANGELAVAQSFVSDSLQARRATGGKVDYILPAEGATFWIDNLVIPVSAPHLEEAEALINFLLAGKSGVTTVTRIFVASANKETYSLLPEEFRNNTMLFPPPAAMAKAEMIEDLGAALVLWDRAWTEIKASSQ